MNIKDLSINELKALAYDHLVNIESSQNFLRSVNQRISELNNERKSLNPEEIIGGK